MRATFFGEQFWQVLCVGNIATLILDSDATYRLSSRLPMWICLQKATACKSLASSSSSSVLQPTFWPSWSGRDEQLLNPAFNVIRRRCKERHTGVRWLAPLILSTCSLSPPRPPPPMLFNSESFFQQNPKLLDPSDAAAAAQKPAQKSSASKPFLLMKTQDPHCSPWAKKGALDLFPNTKRKEPHAGNKARRQKGTSVTKP